MSKNTVFYWGRIGCYALLIVFAFMSIALDVNAQEVDSIAVSGDISEGLAPPMPEIPRLPDEVFMGGTVEVSDEPLGDKWLAYSMRIPAEWEKVGALYTEGEFSLSKKFLQEIGRYWGPAVITGTRSYISIHAIILDYQVAAEQWLLNYLLARNVAIEGFVTHDMYRAEALYVEVEGDKAYKVRLLVQLNGKRAILVHHYEALDQWDNMKAAQKQVLESFTVLNRDSAFGEDMTRHDILDITSVKYPVSWTMSKPVIRSIDRLMIKVLNVPDRGQDKMAGLDFGTKTHDGKIEMRMVSKFEAHSLEEEIERHEKDLMRTGLTLGDVLETREDVYFDDDILFGKVEVYNVTNQNDLLAQYESWIAMMADQDYFYFVSLLTPSREDNYFLWSRNMHTFRLFLENIEPNTNSRIRKEN